MNIQTIQTLQALRTGSPSPLPSGFDAFRPSQRIAEPGRASTYLDPGTVGDAAALGQGLSAATLQAVLDTIDTGVIVCDSRGRLMLANEPARRELVEASVLRVHDDGSLDVAGGVGLLKLRGALHQAVSAGRRQLLPLRHGEHGLMLTVQPLLAGSTTMALILIGRRQLAPELLIEMIGRVYELTPAERRILVGLLAGMRVAALAKTHGVAVSTVRAQVAALRTKFGVRRLDDLTRLVAELPPMTDALRTPLPPLGGADGVREALAATPSPRPNHWPA